MASTQFRNDIRAIASIENQTKRRAMFLALLNRELESRGSRPTFLVGGFAVEIYTAGNYTSGDVDIKGPQEAIESLLLEVGFQKFDKSNYGDEELGIYVQWLGEGPHPPFECRERAIDVSLGDPDLRVRMICYEDLMIDRMCQTKYWGNPDGVLWARAIAESLELAGQKLDWTYLEARARDEDISDVLSALRDDHASI